MITTPKKSKAPRPDFADARKACRTAAEHEQLALVIKAGWKSSELSEYARLYFFRNNTDYPTSVSYRRAIADLAEHYAGLPYFSPRQARSHFKHRWLEPFRKGGSKIMPPRREGLLIRTRSQYPRIDSSEYSWPQHTEEFRAMIEQRCRDYFKIPPGQAVHPNAWAASQRWYWREKQEAEAKAREALKPPKKPKKPKKKSRKPAQKKLTPPPLSYSDLAWERVLLRHQRPIQSQPPNPAINTMNSLKVSHA